ncbi:MAG: acyl-CoA thioesterase [Spirochaetia bacterium]|nr:acyl-CoA thioesterase [Spirochaetia bacterium]
METINYEMPIYTFDIDFNSHVSNIVYIRWMEIGRLKLLDAVGMEINKIIQQGFGPVLMETSISYKKPLLLSDKVKVELWVSELGKASAWLQFRFYNQMEELAASGAQRGLFIDFVSGKPRRISDEERSKFEPYLIKENK